VTTRRQFGRSLLGGAAALAMGGCAGRDRAAADATTGMADDGAVCTVYPEQIEGPFYLDEDQVRRDLIDDRTGAPLAVALRVLAVGGCAPLAGVAVDLWHCDAGGLYSGYPDQLGGVDTTGMRFLRGTQVTGPDGRVEFATIYPGWYPGRTTHIHMKVRLPDRREATSQLYFPEEVTAAIYRAEPYLSRGGKDTSNADDFVQRGERAPLMTVSAMADGHRAAIDVVVADQLS
jgi:protocatechuate 3,4-dioxygenase beta subunit